MLLLAPVNEMWVDNLVIYLSAYTYVVDDFTATFRHTERSVNVHPKYEHVGELSFRLSTANLNLQSGGFQGNKMCRNHQGSAELCV